MHSHLALGYHFLSLTCPTFGHLGSILPEFWFSSTTLRFLVPRLRTGGSVGVRLKQICSCLHLAVFRWRWFSSAHSLSSLTAFYIIEGALDDLTSPILSSDRRHTSIAAALINPLDGKECQRTNLCYLWCSTAQGFPFTSMEVCPLSTMNWILYQ